jgi:hypothetical protein
VEQILDYIGFWGAGICGKRWGEVVETAHENGGGFALAASVSLTLSSKLSLIEQDLL